MYPNPLPATQTKSLPLLTHPIPRNPTTLLQLIQTDHPTPSLISSASSSSSSNHLREEDAGTQGTTGTTLWLGAQVLACYLASVLPIADDGKATGEEHGHGRGNGKGKGNDHINGKSHGHSPNESRHSIGSSTKGKEKSKGHVLDLGSGIGYLPLTLASWGYKVIATDIEPVLSKVLRLNVEENLRILRSTLEGVGDVEVRGLDWRREGDVLDMLSYLEHLDGLDGLDLEMKGESSCGRCERVCEQGTLDCTRDEGTLDVPSPTDVGDPKAKGILTCVDEGEKSVTKGGSSYKKEREGSTTKGAASCEKEEEDPTTRWVPSCEKEGQDAVTTELSACKKEAARDYPNERKRKGIGLEMIITSDTLYAPNLLLPLLKTLSAIFKFHTHHQLKPPILYVALERRDSALIDGAVEMMRKGGIELRKVGRGRVGRSLGDVGWGWGAGAGAGGGKGEEEEEGGEDGQEGGSGDAGDEGGWFEGVEVWKGRWRGQAE